MTDQLARLEEAIDGVQNYASERGEFWHAMHGSYFEIVLEAALAYKHLMESPRVDDGVVELAALKGGE